MGRGDIIIGHATIKDFAYWINERHLIWTKRNRGESKPWTDDSILRDYKFTNAFRELDKGTLALRKMVPWTNDFENRSVVFNIVWYRMFNRYEHATNVGFCYNWDELNTKMRECERAGNKLFTGAHMTISRPGEAKIDTMLNTLKLVWNEMPLFLVKLLWFKRLEEAFEWLLSRPYTGIGPFIAYEIVTDLRHYNQFWLQGGPTDCFTWANLGPGCIRGLKRLGYEYPTLLDVRKIYESVQPHLDPLVQMHLPFPGDGVWPLLELREIEHSLCEFDKYQRVLTGVGRPRQKFNGRA